MEQEEVKQAPEPQEPGTPGGKQPSNIKAELISWIKTIVLALVLALCINTFVIVNATVPTGSMENTIMPQDRIVAFRLAYLFDDPDRGDIVVFRYPDDPTGDTLYVKRIIGLPGETVTISDGVVFIDGVALPESYLKEEAFGDFGPYTVPEGCYFMMGDNRNNSEDSRYWTNTFVEKEDLLGKVIFRYYPSLDLISSN